MEAYEQRRTIITALPVAMILTIPDLPSILLADWKSFTGRTCL